MLITAAWYKSLIILFLSILQPAPFQTHELDFPKVGEPEFHQFDEPESA